MSIKKTAVALLVAALVVASIGAQEVSEKQEVAVFRLAYYGAPVQETQASASVKIDASSIEVSLQGSGDTEVDRVFQNAFGSIDQAIQSVFVNLGRFTVSGLNQRLVAGDINAFIDALKQYKEANMEIPEGVQLGEQFFTEADFNKLVGSFIVVVPTVTYYNMQLTDGGNYDADIAASFAFVDVATLETFAQFEIEASGLSDNRQEAVREAVENLTFQLDFQVRDIDKFKIRTGVIAVNNRTITMQFGNDMGLRVGDEYAVLQTITTPGGFTDESQTALMIVKDVRNYDSDAYLLFGEPAPMVGDQLLEVPRLGVEITPYASAWLDLSGESVSVFPLIGVRGTMSRGFFSFRPQAGLELPLMMLGEGGFDYIMVSSFVGGEYNMYMGRLKLNPNGAIGVAGWYHLEWEEFYLTHFTARAAMGFSLLLGEGSSMVTGEAGFSYWLSLSEYSSDILAPFIGVGFTIK